MPAQAILTYDHVVDALFMTIFSHVAPRLGAKQGNHPAKG